MTTASAAKINPCNETDAAKVAEIAASMKAKGWVGRPLLVVRVKGGRFQALTGSHRTMAARKAKVSVPVEVIEAQEIEAWEAPTSGLQVRPAAYSKSYDVFVDGLFVGDEDEMAREIAHPLILAEIEANS